jgi:signal peptidase I
MIHWLFSKTRRDAIALRKHVQRLLDAQRDLMTPAALQVVRGSLLELQSAIADRAKKQDLRKKMDLVEEVAGKWLRPHPHPAIRENVEVLLVALAVAMGIRTFFVQPFKIPTGSMQPTLYGVMSTPNFGNAFSEIRAGYDGKADMVKQLELQKNLVIPTGWARVVDWIHGNSYVHVVAKADGVIDQISPMRKFLIFNIKQSFWIAGVEHVMWFPPDYGEQDLVRRAGLVPGHNYHKGDDVVKLEVDAGDHLFVDRLTYNFRKPTRGEIIVFETAGIPKEARDQFNIPADEFYIKRLTVLPGEKVKIGNDRHLVINGERLDASTPHFENVYGFDPNKPPRESEYSGHVNGWDAQTYNLYPGIAPLFPDDATIFTNPPDSYMVMGDNTCNSLDSRSWGPLSARAVIGKSFFVYWPITKRFGVGHSITAQ